MADLREIARDPDFQALPQEEQLKALRESDPDIGSLPQEQQVLALKDLGGTQVQAPAQRTQKDILNRPGVQMVENLPKSLMSLITEKLYPAIRHPLKTAEGIGTIGAGGIEKLSDLLGQGLEKVIPGFQKAQPGPDVPAFEQAVQPITESFKNPAGVPLRALNYAEQDPAMALMNTSMLAKGVGGLAGKMGATNTAAGIGKVAEAMDPVNALMKGSSAIIGGAGKLSREALGFTTGQKSAGINQVYSALKQGGDPAATARQYARGKLQSEDVVAEYKGALQSIRNDQMNDYQTRLKALESDKTTSVDMAPIRTQLTKRLSDYGVTFGKGNKLDFTRSKAFAADTQGQADITKIKEILDDWGRKPGDTTPFMMDTLKGILHDFYSPSSKAREFVADLEGMVKDKIIEKVPEYKTMLKNYQTRSEIFEDSKRMLGMKSATDRKANADLLLKRLQTTMREDPEYRRDFINKIEKESGKDIKTIIASYSMSGMLPSGLVGRGMAGGSLFEIAKHGLDFDPHLALMLGASSPRAVFEFLNVMAKTSRAAGAVKGGVEATTTARQAAIQAGAVSKNEQDQKSKNRYKRLKKGQDDSE